MMIRIVAVAALLFGFAAMADETADRANLVGSWQLQDAGAGGGATDVPSLWTFENKGDMFRISITGADQKAAAFECNTMGRECDLKEHGKSAKVSLYFSGPRLIELETIGSDVVKRRFSATPDELVVEVIPVVPPGKTETFRYKRAPNTVAGGASTSPSSATSPVQEEPQSK